MSECGCEDEPQQQPNWEYDVHDIIGISFSIAGGCAQVFSQGLAMIGREFLASAAWRRDRRAEYREQVRNDMTFAELIGAYPMELEPEEPNDG
jgi:hypothetical protein